MNVYCNISSETMVQHEWVKNEDRLAEMKRLTGPITPTEVTQALRDLHPNKDDWTVFERSNMERALYKFLTARKDNDLCSPKDSHQTWIGLSKPSLPPADGPVCDMVQARLASSPSPAPPATEDESKLK